MDRCSGFLRSEELWKKNALAFHFLPELSLDFSANGESYRFKQSAHKGKPKKK
jgi:hypothetical protein